MDDCIFVWYVDFFLKFAHGVNEYMLIIEESMKSQQKVNTYFLIISFFDLPEIRSMPPSLLMVYIRSRKSIPFQGIHFFPTFPHERAKNLSLQKGYFFFS